MSTSHSERQLIEKVTLCSRCSKPAHASESNDDGVCVTCIARDVHKHQGDAFIREAHIFVCHRGDASECVDGCDALAEEHLVDALYQTAGDVLS